MKGNTTMKKIIDRQLLLSKTDILSIAEKIGIRIGKMNGKRVQILCPAHEDRHFGSCILDLNRQRFHCFACNASGNAIDLVMAHNNWPLDDGQKAYEAMKIIAELSGIDYHTCEKNINAPTIDMPSKEELELIGLSDTPVFSTDHQDPTRRIMISAHPLRDFAEDDYHSFQILIYDKIVEAEVDLINLRRIASKEADTNDMCRYLVGHIDQQLSTLQKMKLRYIA